LENLRLRTNTLRAFSTKGGGFLTPTAERGGLFSIIHKKRSNSGKKNAWFVSSGTANLHIMFRPSCAQPVVALMVFVAASFLCGAAVARPTGEAQGCGNCHYKPNGPELAVSFSKASVALGETVTLKVEIKAVNAEAKRTGVWVSGDGKGKFGLIDTKGTRLHLDTGVLHAEPKTLVDGKADFSFRWTAPSVKGVSDFTVASITGNSNGDSEDDHSSSARVSVAYGCDAKTYYPDADSDGFGDAKQGQLSCDPISGFILRGQDCNDEKREISPDAKEMCNAVDDNCDGVADEGLEPGIYFKDEDGDGFAANGAKPEFTCKTEPGFVAVKKDCAPKDPNINPDAKEIKNGKDDNCDGQTDESDGSQGGQTGEDQTGGVGGTSENEEMTVGGCSVAIGANSSNPAAIAMMLTAAFIFAVRRRAKRS